MHSRSQVSHNVRTDVADKADNGTKPRCGICKRRKGHYDSCLIFTGTENVDFVTCKICDAKFVSLAKHITGTHGLTKERYLVEHGGQIKCDATTKRYSDQNKINCEWISRAKENGDDLTEYRAKMGAAVSKAIMSNPVERARRAKTMGENNKTDEARLKSSITARKTSKRQDILDKRSLNLAKWREENPEKFQETIKKFVNSSTSQSKPQLLAFQRIVKLFPKHEFMIDSQVYLETVIACKTHRPIIDIISRKEKIVVEIDGIYHFESIRGSNLQKLKERDRQVNEALVKLGYRVIRISYDTWKHSGEIRDEHFEKIENLISDAQPGLYFIGEHHAGE